MADLQVSKKTIAKLLGDMQGRKFIIPDFQRPYKWNVEKCETLWKDIVSFFENDPSDTDYFLGTIVTAENEDKLPEVIDGQQRLTSFFLLLRSFYKKLEDMSENNEVRGLKGQIGPCIWDVDQVSMQVEDFKKIHLKSDVATEEHNEILHKILESGEYDESKKDNYTLNYHFFKNACDDYAQKNPMEWYKLAVTILNRCILLPIEATNQETALTIFSTLNDRGMPLADSDIFKAQIYKANKTKKEREVFSELWKELTETCTDTGFTIDDVFRYYSHVLRAKAGDKTKEIGLRKFYAVNTYSRLKANGLMKDIMDLAYFWKYINTRTEPEEEDNYKIGLETRKYLHVLNHYPNEFWKYPTSVFFFKYRTQGDFDKLFKEYLQKITAFLFTKFVYAPTVNAIKDDIYNTCITIWNGQHFDRNVKFDTTEFLNKLQEHSSSRLMRPLLLLEAYLFIGQTELIKPRFDVEHIFPKKWQDTNYNGWDEEDAQKYLDRFGNKVVFEKRLNIQAGNGYFGRKKEKYKDSEIAIVKKLANYHKDDWVKDDIERRENEFKDRITTFIIPLLNIIQD